MLATLQNIYILVMCTSHITHTGGLKSKKYCPSQNSSTAHTEHLFSKRRKSLQKGEIYTSVISMYYLSLQSFADGE